MTQQFKFGDPVRWSEDPRRFVYIEADPFYDGQAGWILSDDNAEYLASHSALEPIPHPDTERLDWLADPGQNSGHVLLPTECVHLNLHDMRAAIDMAMQMHRQSLQKEDHDQ